MQKYLQKKIDENNVTAALMEMAFKSRALLAIVPMQDVLDLDETGRMNVPGTVYGNREWRLSPESVSQARASHLAQLVQNTQR